MINKSFFYFLMSLLLIFQQTEGSFFSSARKLFSKDPLPIEDSFKNEDWATIKSLIARNVTRPELEIVLKQIRVHSQTIGLQRFKYYSGALLRFLEALEKNEFDPIFLFDKLLSGENLNLAEKRAFHYLVTGKLWFEQGLYGSFSPLKGQWGATSVLRKLFFKFETMQLSHQELDQVFWSLDSRGALSKFLFPQSFADSWKDLSKAIDLKKSKFLMEKKYDTLLNKLKQKLKSVGPVQKRSLQLKLAALETLKGILNSVPPEELKKVRPYGSFSQVQTLENFSKIMAFTLILSGGISLAIGDSWKDFEGDLQNKQTEFDSFMNNRFTKEQIKSSSDLSPEERFNRGDLTWEEYLVNIGGK